MYSAIYKIYYLYHQYIWHGIGFETIEDTLYAVFFPSDNTARLYTVNINTGLFSAVAGNQTIEEQDGGGLIYYDNVLYMICFSSVGSRKLNIYSVNTTNGTFTLEHTTTFFQY